MNNDDKYVGIDERYKPKSENENGNSVLEEKQNDTKRVNKVAKLLVGGLIFWVLLVLGIMISIAVFGFSQFNKMQDRVGSIQDKASGLIENGINIPNDAIKKQQKTTFNSIFESSVGREPGMSAVDVIDNVIENNKKAAIDTENGRIVTVVWGEKKMTDPTELKDSKKDMGGENKYNAYEISVEYDKDGYVYQVIIETLNEPFM